MSGLEQHLKDPEYANWLKNVQALNFTLDVLKPFVYQELKAIQTSITHKGPKVKCSSCNVSKASNCPRKVCNVYKEEIVKSHRRADPSFCNTNARKWKSDAWEIAKCFIPPIPGNKHCTQTEADFSAIINIIINCKHFDVLVSCDLKRNRNMFWEAKEMRNMLMHPGGIKVSSANLQKNIDLLISLVQCLKNRPPNTEDKLKKIEQLKTEDFPISLHDVTDIRNQAILAAMEEIDKGRETIKNYVETCIKTLRQEILTATPTWKASEHRLIGNFIKGCKHSLIRLIASEIERVKPKRYQQQEWNFKEFLNKIELFPDVESLHDGHKCLLYPEDGSTSDINKWDLFLLCHILSLETSVERPNHLVCYLRDLSTTRDKILNNPDSIREEDLELLTGYLDEELRAEIKSIFADKATTDDALKLQSELKSWQEYEKDMKYKQIGTKAFEETKKVIQRVDSNRAEDRRQFKKLCEVVGNMMKWQTPHPEHKEQIDQLRQYFETFVSILNNEEDINSFDTQVEIQINESDPEEEELIQSNMTSEDPDDNIALAGGGMSHLQEELDLETAKIVKGSIILKVTCKSVKDVIRFWDSCMDGSAVRAMSKIRDDYRKQFECGSLEFAIVLTKNEVQRCMNHLVEKMSSRLLDENTVKEIQAKVTMLQTVPGPPSKLPLRKDLKHGDEEATRLAKFLRQMAESFEEGSISVVKPYLYELTKHSREKNQKAFDESVIRFTEATSFKGGISVSLIKQVHRGFHMILDEPEFGDLVVAKVEAIEKEEQSIAGETSGVRKSSWPSDVKSTVIIAEDIQVGGTKTSKSQGDPKLDVKIIFETKSSKEKQPEYTKSFSGNSKGYGPEPSKMDEYTSKSITSPPIEQDVPKAGQSESS